MNTFEIHLPPLRDRKTDIVELARHLLARSAKRPLEQVADLLTGEAIEVLYDHHWEGNVRELANAMEYAYIVAGGGPITVAHLPQQVRLKRTRPSTSAPTISANPMILPMPTAGNSPRTLHDIEMEHILRVLEKNNHNKPKTAQELGISLKTLYNKLNRWEEERKSAG